MIEKFPVLLVKRSSTRLADPNSATVIEAFASYAARLAALWANNLEIRQLDGRLTFDDPALNLLVRVGSGVTPNDAMTNLFGSRSGML